LSMQFRAEFFNIFNQHVFATPGLTPQSGAGVSSNMRTLGSPGFGVSTATLFDPREIQLGLRLIF
jgi:hypothetical protein